MKDTLDSSVDTEPINFSFYFKDEISSDVKNVMKMVDEMLINETQKGASVDEKVKKVQHEIETLPMNIKNISEIKHLYANLNVKDHVLNWSKMEETEVE